MDRAFGSALAELVKLGEIEPHEARRTLDRLENLEQRRPTADQALRYGTIGAIAGPIIGAAGDLIAGKKPFGAGFRIGAQGLERTTKKQIAKNIASDSMKGMIGAGAIPLAQNALDQHAERGKLNRFMQEYEAVQRQAPAPEVPQVIKAGGVGQGASMTTSEYSGPTGYGSFNLVSGLPNKAVPGLQSVVEKKAAMGILMPTGKTPSQRLQSAKEIGTAAHNKPPGPSIDQIAGRVQPPAFKAPGMPKLPGWGKPATATTKATEGLSMNAMGGI